MRASALSLVCFILVVSLAVPGSLAQSDPVTGTWYGDWGPSQYDRNDVVVELTWDGSSLKGVVNPGPNAIELSNASFDPATGMVKMEADAQSFRGEIHYTIEGTLDGDTIKGSWSHDNVNGDFTITKSS